MPPNRERSNQEDGRILVADNESLPEMLFAGRSGPRQLLFLADSGASGCILGTKTAAEICLPITPWTHEGEGFKCANEAVTRVVGTSTMPLTIQIYVRKAHVHVSGQPPIGHRRDSRVRLDEERTSHTGI